MKAPVIKTLIIGLILSATSTTLNAQQKFGCINTNTLINSMPENDSAQNILNSKRAEFEKQTEELQVEVNRKYELYMRQRDTLNPIIRKVKEDEINSLSQNIDNFNRAADQEMQRLNKTLYDPIVNKAQNAINEVAKEGGFTYIIDLGVGAMVYYPEEGPLNILEAVQQKLGIK